MFVKRKTCVAKKYTDGQLVEEQIQKEEIITSKTDEVSKKLIEKFGPKGDEDA